MPNKVYLGDAVYIRQDNLKRIVLTTEDGLSETNIIILEPEVIESMLMYLAAHQLTEL